MAKRALSSLRNQDWCVTVTEHPDGHVSAGTDYILLFLLADIRDELQQLNRTFGCSNFLAMPQALQDIAREARAQRRIRLAKEKK